MADAVNQQKIQGYCALCLARCGSISTVQDGRFIAQDPDPSHPTGQALCAKGRAAPELVYSPDRLLHPLKRTRPKGDADPGWQQIGWDEALDMTASAMRRIAQESGPEAVAFTLSSPSTTAISDSNSWIRRLMLAFGSPNSANNVEQCTRRDIPSVSPVLDWALVAVPCPISRTVAASFCGATTRASPG